MRHFKAVQSRCIAFFYTDKFISLKIHRKELKKHVRKVVNSFGPQLFKNFDKLRLIAKEGNSRPSSKNATPRKGRSRAASDEDLGYMD